MWALAHELVEDTRLGRVADDAHLAQQAVRQREHADAEKPVDVEDDTAQLLLHVLQEVPLPLEAGGALWHHRVLDQCRLEPRLHQQLRPKVPADLPDGRDVALERLLEELVCAKRIVIESGWVSKLPAFTGKLRPRRLNNHPLYAPYSTREAAWRYERQDSASGETLRPSTSLACGAPPPPPPPRDYE
eukprot:COSAG01_NODE_4600_length_4887_cov_2.583542_8_plen_188_part_00